ncbi:hypothetical protein AB0P12_21130 [Streptomyces subrutilus]|uniref:hypothetical protein n=1 Tax=Streptomyces subrutilus TaxID=36818 RepID=UPI003415021D
MRSILPHAVPAHEIGVQDGAAGPAARGGLAAAGDGARLGAGRVPADLGWGEAGPVDLLRLAGAEDLGAAVRPG